VGVVVLIAAACSPSGDEAVSTGARSADLPENPNIVVVVVDDMRWDEFGAAGHPYLETPNIDRLATEGAMFMNSFHAVPLCSPNRASLLTGQYPSQHGIVDNVARVRTSFALNTFPQALQTVGYETAFLGKWHMGNDPRPRDGWDYWVGQPGQGRSIDPELYEDGRLHVVEGYTTDILNDRAIDFIRQERDGPFMVYMAHKAIHPDVQQLDDGSTPPGATRGYVPAPRHRGRYSEEVFPKRPNTIATLAELDGKPAVQGALALRATGSRQADYGSIPSPEFSETDIRGRAEMLLAVDEGLGRVLETLESEGVLDNTVVIFTSENGFFFNEHGLTTERRLPYEEAIRNPFIVRYPPAAIAGDRLEALSSTIDLAPTVLDFAGAPIGDHIQGRSLVPVMLGDTDGWRTSVFVEFYTYENPFPHLLDMDYRAVRTDRYKYIHWVRHPGLDELYDLEVDPFEIENRADDPALASVRAELRAALGEHMLGALGLGS
jgi:N-acetylglucosamine-6-sulfatase